MSRNVSQNYENSSDVLCENLIWLTVKQAAIYLSRSENAIRLLIYKGVLSAHRLGGRVYLKKSEIDRILNQSILGGQMYGS